MPGNSGLAVGENDFAVLLVRRHLGTLDSRALMMTPQEFSSVKRGDILRNEGSGNSYVVTGDCGNGCKVLTLTIMASSPEEWTLFKSEPPKPREWWAVEYRTDPWLTQLLDRKPLGRSIHVREVLE